MHWNRQNNAISAFHLNALFSVSAIWEQGFFWTRTNCRRFMVGLVEEGDVLFTQSNIPIKVGAGNIFLVQKKRDHLLQVGPSGHAKIRIVCIEGPVLDSGLSLLGVGAESYQQPNTEVFGKINRCMTFTSSIDGIQRRRFC